MFIIEWKPPCYKLKSTDLKKNLNFLRPLSSTCYRFLRYIMGRVNSITYFKYYTMQSTQDTQGLQGSKPVPRKKITSTTILWILTAVYWIAGVPFIFNYFQSVHQRTLPVFSQTAKPTKQLPCSANFYYITAYDVNPVANKDKSDLILTLEDGRKQLAAGLPSEQLAFTLSIMRNGWVFDKQAQTIVTFSNNVPPPRQTAVSLIIPRQKITPHRL